MIWIAVGFLVLLVAYLLFVPLILYIDTDQKTGYLRIKGLARASVESHDRELIRIRIDALFTHFYFYPLQKILEAKNKKKGKTRKHKKKRSKKDIAYLMRYGKIGKRLWQSFEVIKFRVDMDTGDCIQNARLYPVAAFVDRYLFDFNINYQNRIYLGLHLVNRPIYILKAFINP